MTPRRKIIPVFVPHAGCPNACVFCNQKRISGSLFSADAKTVKEALQKVSGSGYELAFYGGSFTAIPAAEQEELLTAAQPFLKSGKISSIRCSTRPDAVDEEVLSRLKSLGVETVELGCQSMNDDVLALSKRGHTADDVRRSSDLIKKAGFSLILQMMTGLPGSDRQRDIESARELIALQPDGMRIYPTVVIRDTELCDMFFAGEYAEHTVAEAVQTCADILPLCEQAGVRIIRLGLNPTEELSGGAAVAGAYHPAFGELVYSEIYRRRAAKIIRERLLSGRVTAYVPKEKVSLMTGQHRCNILQLKNEFSLDDFCVKAAALSENELLIETDPEHLSSESVERI